MGYGRIRVSGDMDDLGEGFASNARPARTSGSGLDANRRELAVKALPGLEFYGRAGGPVRAAADGTCRLRAPDYGAYGLMVILDHGGSFYTVYGGLGCHRRPGGRLGRHEHPSSARSTPSRAPTPSSSSRVRRGTRPLDARSWLGL